MSDPISSYIADVQRNLQAGIAREHTYRPALKTLVEALATGVAAFNDPKRVECGAPDYTVARSTKHGPLTIGYIEAKDIDTDLQAIERDAARKKPETRNGEQLKRYLTLPNLILTDYLDFRWYVDGERRMAARLARPIQAGKLQREPSGPEAVAQLIRAFLDHRPPPVSKPRDLALRMARLTHHIRDMIITAFDTAHASTTLRELHRAFEETLVPDLKLPDFADMYAQTLAYGLFAARVNHTGPQPFRRLGAAAEIPKTNPFLRRLFDAITGTALDDEPYVGLVDDLAQLLAETDIPAVLADFGKRGVRQDPVLHFYETFLAAYDPQIREMRGVYYTPEPVVSYIVRFVDHLLKTRFGCPQGLADASTVTYTGPGPDGEQREETSHRVLILDPACGTGTFLYTVVDLIREEFMRQGNAGMWPGYVRQNLLPRLFGFELMMAPYAMAHLKLAMQLAAHDLPQATRPQWAYDFVADDRIGVYLTNTLEEAIKKSQILFASYISDEANAAADIKRALPIMVVLGNPPYSNFGRMNKGRWISALLQDYKRGLKEKKLNLDDDFIKFIRFGQWRIEESGAGILAYIANHTYIDAITHRRMRESLMETFTDIYILDLHGNTRKKERCPDGSKDENVFDIQQGVAIGIFVKEPGKQGPAKVHHADLWGLREAKYARLFEADVATTDWNELQPKDEYFFFVPKDFSAQDEYQRWWSTKDIFAVAGQGIETKRDALTIRFLFQQVEESVQDVRRGPKDAVALKYALPDDGRDWTYDWAREDVIGNKGQIAEIAYRPFDFRFTYFTGKTKGFIAYPRTRVSRCFLEGRNLGLIVNRFVKLDHYAHVFVTRSLVERHLLETANACLVVYPLSDPDSHERDTLDLGGGGKRLNLTAPFLSALATKLSLPQVGRQRLPQGLTPENIFHYIYAVLHSPTYRTRYAQFLKIDFPRIPLTSDLALFRTLCARGKDLVDLHLMESPLLGHAAAEHPCPVGGDNTVEKGHPRYLPPGQPDPATAKPLAAGRVYISRDVPKTGKTGQYFDGVPPEVWNFQVGGYQVCEKWLKDRRGRTLSYDDLAHYQKIIVALKETIRLMAEIDAAIPSWPLP
ncbi:MAG: type ISP restriction/modification enzyme [Dehalococcoidia bacterium]